MRLRVDVDVDQTLRDALDMLPIVAFTATAEGQIDWVNRRWYEATGIERDAVLGEAWIAVVHPEDAEEVVWQWTRAIDAGTPCELSARVRGADGRYRRFYSRAEPLGDDGNRRWIGTSVDISSYVREEPESSEASEERAAEHR